MGNRKRKLLLIGGAGYIGSILTAHFLQKSYFVTVLDTFLYQNGCVLLPHLSNSNFKCVYGDLTCKKTLADAFSGVTDVIILAGLVGDPITKKYPEYANHINLDGIKNLISQLSCHPLDKVIFISTCSNYGLIQGNILADENFELKPLSLYAKAKVEIEKLLLSLKGKVNYSATILRFATAFGLSPRMRFDLTVNEFTRELSLGNLLTVYDEETWRPYCHVLDFASVLQKVLEAPKEDVYFEVFNAGIEKNNYTKKMIIDEIKKFIPEAVVRYQSHGSDPRNYRVDFSKIKRVLQFEPYYSISDGVKEVMLAMKNKCFDDITLRPNFYGNYYIHNVPQPETV